MRNKHNKQLLIPKIKNFLKLKIGNKETKTAAIKLIIPTKKVNNEGLEL